ncbi:hypothetical protein QOZ80_4BG0345310 [Eleusine coracana subsp. coracana]|nr:hypothetical protein QOZ80_4BG0345310 [Eleusine coracana subsp. coracana]
MKQKIVIKVHMTCDKCRKKALGIAVSAHGVMSVGITGDAKDRLEVIGDGVDSVRIVNCLRRKVGPAEIMQVEEMKDNKKEEKEDKNKGHKEKEGNDKNKQEKKLCCPGYPYYCYCHSIRPPPIIVCEEDPICSIM